MELELKSGIIVSEIFAKNGNKVILRYPKWEDLNSLVVYWNDIFEESEKDLNFGILFEKRYSRRRGKVAGRASGPDRNR